MKWLLRLPLHYQILVALIVGTAAGLALNPGEVALDPIRYTLSTENGRIALRVDAVPPRADPLRSETLDRADFATRYPALARLLDDKRELAVTETKRRLQIVEDGETVSIQYSRRQNDDLTITNYQAESARKLTQAYPQWSDVYQEHGGGLRRQAAIFAKRVGDLFLRLLKMITIPLIVTSLVTGVSGLGSAGRLRSMFTKTIGYYVTTSVLAITTGITMVNLIRPGVGAKLPGGGAAVDTGGEQTLLGVFGSLLDNMIPANPIASLAGAEFLSIITFSILFGIFILLVGGESGATMRKFFTAAFDVVMHMTMAIIRLAPIGVLAFMLFATASQGLAIFQTLAWYMLAVFLALVVHAVIVLPLVLRFVAGRAPAQFAQAMSPALMTAFSTASSNGTLPLTLTCAEDRAGISNRVSSFVLPLGATINMDGTALYEAVAVLFIAQATPGFAMTLESQIVVALTALLASIGAAGIPHAGLVMMAIVLQAVGLPLEAQGVIIAVDRVLDMCRTSVNVWSDSCGCAVLSRLEPDSAPAD